MCSIEGNQTEIDKALKMIRDKFPIKKYSEVTLEQVQLGVSTVPLSPDCLYVNIIFIIFIYTNILIVSIFS